MTKDVIDAMKDRVSTRSYKAKEVPDATIGRILEAAHLAPSAGNIQPWEFYVVKNGSKIEELTRLAHNQDWMSEAPVVIVVCANLHLSGNKYGERGEKLYAIQDTSAAIENMLLAAEAYGLGSCWVGAFDENEVKKLLGIKQELMPIALVTIGYNKGEVHEVRPQRAIEDIVTIIN